MKSIELLINYFWKFFKSLKLSFVLLALIIIACILGTLIVQTPLSSRPVEMLYHPLLVRSFHFLNLFDLYHSWWFIFLLTLFFINLTVCTCNHLPNLIKKLKDPLKYLKTSAKENFYYTIKISSASNKKISEILKLQGFTFTKNNAENISDNPTSALHEAKFTGSNENKFQEKTHLLFHKIKNRFSPLNVSIVHLGILLIMLGSILASTLGLESDINLYENQTTSSINIPGTPPLILPLSFAIKNKKFWITYYENFPNTPKQYSTKLEILSHGKLVKELTTSVNSPAKYKGFYFYQSSWGSEANFQFEINFKNQVSSIQAYHHEKTKLPFLEGFIIPIDYVESSEENAVLVHIFTNNSQMRAPIWLKKDTPLRLNNISIRYSNNNKTYYSTLKIAKNPGTPLLWLGFVLTTLGLFLVCFYRIEVYRIKLTSNVLEIEAFGNSLFLNKNKFKTLVKTIEEKLNDL